MSLIPGGLSLTDFKIMALESGQWLWGTVQGAFNQKASLSQIVVDAVIGMIPLVGDVTAVRDLIAVSIRLIDDPEKRKEVWEWVLLVVLVLALIPVLGGVLKGTGRLVIKAAGEGSKIANAAAKAAHFHNSAKDIIAFLNRVGHGHAEKWLLKLKFAEHQTAVMGHFKGLMETMTGALTSIENKIPNIAGGIKQRIKGLKQGIKDLKALGENMIPKAIKELDTKLREIQQFIHSGGNTTSKAVEQTAVAGDKAAIHLADEARLIEQAGAKVSARGGLKQNPGLKGDPDVAKLYSHKPGYPDVRQSRSWDGKIAEAITKDGHYYQIEAYAGKIVQRELKEGEELYRLFGPAGSTHGVQVRQTYASGDWWGLGKPPKTAEEWRMKAAVKDEWNRDGFIVTAKVPKDANVKASVGLISEQAGKDLPGQYLTGGGMQAMIWFDTKAVDKVTGKTMGQLGEQVMKSGKATQYTDSATGMVFHIQPTGWMDANGIWGYAHVPGTGAVQTARLGAREMAAKDEQQKGKK